MIKEKIYELDLENLEGEVTHIVPLKKMKETKNLDDNGIIIPGTKIKPHDILIGISKVIPEEEQTAHEKLLKSIFADDVVKRDVSIKVADETYGMVKSVTKSVDKIEIKTLEAEVTEKIRNDIQEKLDKAIQEIKTLLPNNVRIRSVTATEVKNEREDVRDLIEKYLKSKKDDLIDDDKTATLLFNLTTYFCSGKNLDKPYNDAFQELLTFRMLKNF